jgi:hypothetical protein
MTLRSSLLFPALSPPLSVPAGQTHSADPSLQAILGCAGKPTLSLPCAPQPIAVSPVYSPTGRVAPYCFQSGGGDPEAQSLVACLRWHGQKGEEQGKVQMLVSGCGTMAGFTALVRI